MILNRFLNKFQKSFEAFFLFHSQCIIFAHRAQMIARMGS